MAYLKKDQVVKIELKNNVFDRLCKRLDMKKKMSEVKDM